MSEHSARKCCRYKHVCSKCNGMHPSVLCNTFKNSHVNRSVRAVQNSNLFNRTSSPRQPMAANVNQIRPNIQNIQLESVRGRFVTENLSFMFFLSYLRYNKRWMFVVSNILRICTNRRVCILLFYVIPLKIAMWIDQWGRYKTVTYLIVQVVPGNI
jgi:hypothetical protein